MAAGACVTNTPGYFGLPNTIITPHMARLSPESEFASYEMAAHAIADVLAGRPPRPRSSSICDIVFV